MTQFQMQGACLEVDKLEAEGRVRGQLWPGGWAGHVSAAGVPEAALGVQLPAAVSM